VFPQGLGKGKKNWGKIGVPYEKFTFEMAASYLQRDNLGLFLFIKNKEKRL